MDIIITKNPNGNSRMGNHYVLSSTLSRLTQACFRLNESKLAFRSALCDSFNTPEALKILRDLVSRTNVYINTRAKNLNVALVEQSARWVGDMLRMFGLGEGERLELGWGQDATNDGNTANVSTHPCTISMSQSYLSVSEEISCCRTSTLSLLSGIAFDDWRSRRVMMR